MGAPSQPTCSLPASVLVGSAAGITRVSCKTYLQGESMLLRLLSEPEERYCQLNFMKQQNHQLMQMNPGLVIYLINDGSY